MNKKNFNSTNYWSSFTEKERKRILLNFYNTCGLNECDFIYNISNSFFSENGLGGLYRLSYRNDRLAILKDLNTNYKPWHMRTVPQGYWCDATIKESVIWMVETVIGKQPEDLRRGDITLKKFKANGLSGMLRNMFTDRVYNCLDYVYGNRIKPWQCAKVPRNFWNKETVTEFVKWIIEVENISKQEIPQILTPSKIACYGGYSLRKLFDLEHCFEIINSIYPNEFKPGDFKRLPCEKLTEDYIREKVKNIIDEYAWTREDICEKFSLAFLQQHALHNILRRYNNSPFEILNVVFPGEFKREDLKGYMRKGVVRK